MINTSSKVIALVGSDDLAASFRAAVEKAERIITSLNSLGRSGRYQRVFSKVFGQGVRGYDVTEKSLQFFCEFACSSASKDIHLINELTSYLPRNLKLSHTDARALKTPLRIIFCHLHASKSIVLPYFFTRPILKGLDSLPIEDSCYCETLIGLRSLDNRLATGSNTKRAYSAEERASRRVFELGAKIVLASTWFTPEDLIVEDFAAWRTHVNSMIKAGRTSEISPLPLSGLLAALGELFPGRVGIDPQDWEALSSKSVTRSGVKDSRLIRESLGLSLDPEQVVENIKSNNSTFWTAFAPDVIDEFGISAALSEVGIEISHAYNCWVPLQREWLEDANYVQDKQARSALGRLNVYLFIYLPLWFHKYGDEKFKYPIEPKAFTGQVFYYNKMSGSRFLSFTEFCERFDSRPTYGSFTALRIFFKYLIQMKGAVDSCRGLVQPFYFLPRSKKYGKVAKEILTPDQLLSFVDYLYSVENFLTVIFDSRRMFLRAMRAVRIHGFIDTREFGYVPFVLRRGEVVPIFEINGDLLDVISVRGREVINPGVIRFFICLMEGGMRTQALQWLDADSYDRRCTRPFYHPNQITMLWLNTDKIQSYGFSVLSQVKVILTLDRQVGWRNRVAALGFPKLREPILYEGKKTKWGKMIPIFSSNIQTGAPISDNKLRDSWPLICLAFQQWARMTGDQMDDLVGMVPKRNTEHRKTGDPFFFSFPDLLRGIRAKDVKTVSQGDVGRIYAGDYCPVELRARVTPHGLRASFVTVMGTILDIDSVAGMTGQSPATVMYYNKGTSLLRTKVGSPLNYMDVKQYIDDSSSPASIAIPTMLSQSQRIEKARSENTLDKVAAELGLISISSGVNEDGSLKGMQIIARERSFSLGIAHTHICPFNFVCPLEVIETLKGERHCSRCPFAVYSVFNIAAVSAKRHQMAEEHVRLMSALEHYTAKGDPSSCEVRQLEVELKQHSLDLVGWLMIEESLWALIQDLKENKSAQKLLVQDAMSVLSQVERYPILSRSTAEFAARLAEVKQFPLYASDSFKGDMERAARLLMARNGDLQAAILSKPKFEPHEELIGLIAQAAEAPGFDFEMLNQLIQSKDSVMWGELESKRTATGILSERR
ncbi:hypothetical protein [Pseudomonas putida]|uniref:hypothetical protein n=1 Tax=Pseudomonas putida TaxID=303 RepID=UPI003466549B